MLSISRLLLLPLLVGCAAQPAATSTSAAGSAAREPWRVELTSSGGLAGRGNGAFTISSDGSVTVTTMERKSCTFQASDAELRMLAEALQRSRTAAWKESYVPAETCCDRFEWNLVVKLGDREIRTKWIDDPLPMPADLESVIEAITSSSNRESIRSQFCERCRNAG